LFVKELNPRDIYDVGQTLIEDDDTLQLLEYDNHTDCEMKGFVHNFAKIGRTIVQL